VKITEEEIEAIFQELDYTSETPIPLDDFYKLATQKNTDFKKIDAQKSIFRLRAAYSPSIGELVNSYNNMPENYFGSFSEKLYSQCSNLPSAFLRPTLSPSGIYYLDILAPPKRVPPARRHKLEHVTKNPNKRRTT